MVGFWQTLQIDFYNFINVRSVSCCTRDPSKWRNNRTRMNSDLEWCRKQDSLLAAKWASPCIIYVGRTLKKRFFKKQVFWFLTQSFWLFVHSNRRLYTEGASVLRHLETKKEVSDALGWGSVLHPGTNRKVHALTCDTKPTADLTVPSLTAVVVTFVLLWTFNFLHPWSCHDHNPCEEGCDLY